MKVIYKLLVASLAVLVLVLTSASVLAQQPDVIGQWDFNSGDLSPTAGNALEYIPGDTQSRTVFGSTTTLGIPNINGTVANVMSFPTNAIGQGYSIDLFGSQPNGGGSLVNQWTVVFDLLFPAASANKFRALMETDGRAITQDADLMIDANGGIGGNGAFAGQIQANTWYRVAFVVDTPNNVIRKYINGALVGTQPAVNGAVPALDGRWALSPGGTAELFNDDNGQTAPGYVNCIQLRNVALSTLQVRALGGPSAEGVPQVIPPIPSFVDSWIPAGTLAYNVINVGAVVHDGDTDIADASITLRLDGVVQAGPSITRNGDLITVSKAIAALPVSTKHVVQINYTDSLNGAMVFSNQFDVAVFIEDFNGLVLGPKVDEGLAGDTVWTKSGPAGWSTLDWQSDAAGASFPLDPANDGVTEWAGWSFADVTWWATTAGNQNRANFTKATGAAAIFDPDEWDDAGHALGMLNSTLATPSISLAGVAPNTAVMKLDTSWRAECCDDNATLTNDQTFVIYVQYDGGPSNVVLHWSSHAPNPTAVPPDPGDPNFHGDDENGTQIIQLNNPAGASNLKVIFAGLYSENDWWMAFDNLQIVASLLPPTISTQPAGELASAGATVTLSVRANSQAPPSYQWLFNDALLSGATSSNLVLANVQAANAGDYRAIVSNSAGSVTSQVARLEIFSGTITQDLVVHLKFDGDFNDSSGRGNNATAGLTGTPTFVPGKVGTQAMHIQTNDVDAGVQPYATLGTPADLNFGTATDFSISFWVRVVAWVNGGSTDLDASFFSNKDWGSGDNAGYVLDTDGDGRMEWNLADPDQRRLDYDGPGGTFGNNGVGDNVWHHVVVTFDRSGNIATYVDGVKRNTSPFGPGQYNLDTPAGLNTNIGQDGTGSYRPKFSHADFDDVGVWRRVLTSQEAASIYAQGQIGQDLTTATGMPPVLPPTITAQPTSKLASAYGSATFSVTATGDGTLAYQWLRNDVAIAGATSASYTVASVLTNNTGNYKVIVSNAGGSVTSAPALLQIFIGQTDKDLVAWLRFEGNYLDSSGHGNHGTPMGSPSFAPGRVGQSVRVESTSDLSVTNFVTLGYPADLQFGAGDFSVGFWVNSTNQSEDPTYVSNKDWDASANTGWGIFSQPGGNLRINVTGTPSGSGNRMNTTSTPNIKGSGWHHVLVSCWRGQYTSTYVDGALVNSTPLTIVGSVDTVSQGFRVNIGQDGTGRYEGAPIEAFIDEVQMWRRAVTAQDVAYIYGKGTNGQPGSTYVAAVNVSGPSITVAGGTAPYTLQRKASLSDAEWTDIVTTNSPTIIVPVDTQNAFFRVVSRVTFNVALNGANERPAVSPAGTASGTVVLDGRRVTANITYSGMTSAVNNAHIHGPANTEVSAGVLQGLTQSGGTSGTVTGGGVLSGANVQHLLNGNTYVNIHTVNNGGGEIRGQLILAP